MVMISPTLNDYRREGIIWCISCDQERWRLSASELRAMMDQLSQSTHLERCGFPLLGQEHVDLLLARATSCGSVGSPSPLQGRPPAPPRPSRASQPWAPGGELLPLPAAATSEGPGSECRPLPAGGPGILAWSPCKSQLAGMGTKMGRVGLHYLMPSMENKES